jgi:predicted flap endonuclease-1-like 5' DNA nuclease
VIIESFVTAQETLNRIGQSIAGPAVGDTSAATDEQSTFVSSLGEVEEASEPIREDFERLVGEGFDEIEDDILENIQSEGQITPENIEEAVNDAEGAAIEKVFATTAASLLGEIAGGTQVETHQLFLSQLVSLLGAEAIVGSRSGVEFSEAVEPALQQKVNARARAKQADLQDVVEQQLRSKDQDTGYLGDLARYGIKEEDVPVLEEAAISEVGPEELIETPAEAGVLPDEETLQAELDRAGISEDAKEVFLETVAQLPRTTRLYEEATTAEELVRQFDAQVQSGETTPEEATRALPDDVDEARDALRERFELLAANASDPPSDSDTLGHLSRGIIGLQTAGQELSNPGRDDSETTRLLVEEILSELDGDLRTALGLGQIDEAAFSELASVAGVDQDAVNSLLEGDDLDEIALRRLQDSQDPTGQSVESIIGIGDARGSALAARGFATVGDLAGADPEEVADIAQVTVDTARGFVEAARSRTQA